MWFQGLSPESQGQTLAVTALFVTNFQRDTDKPLQEQSESLYTRSQSHPLSPLHEPLHWRAKRDPKAQLLSLQSFLREGRVVGLCWVN